MKKTTLAAVAAITLMVGAAPALAQYQSIVHNLLNGTFDTEFNAGTLTISSTNSNNVTLLDPGPGGLPGSITNAEFNLTSTFNGVVAGQAQFVGGSLSLTFDHDGSPYEISGPVTGLLFDLPVQSPNPAVWTIDGVGRWTATTKSLPGSGIWPDSGGFSSLDSLTFAFNQDLSAFDWANDTINAAETNYQLFPNDSAVPEPTTIALLAIGAAGLIRRRR